MQLEIVILAAGKGTRMCSTLPKVLHLLADKPLLQHVVEVAKALTPSKIHIVYGSSGQQLKQCITDPLLNWIEQQPLLGTGHALQQALPHLGPESQIIVLYGDVPLIRVDTLRALLDKAQQGLAILTALLAVPQGFGRVLRDNEGRICRIVEDRDADLQQRMINEVYSGIMAAPSQLLRQWLPKLNNDNAQQEYYLTDVVALAVASDLAIASLAATDPMEVYGINQRVQLAQLERVYQQQQAERLMLEGVTLRDPSRFDVRGQVQAGQDVEIDINVILEGRVKLGDRVKIGANCILRDVTVADGAIIHANSVLEQADIGENCQVGPFARVRPGTTLAAGAKVGNFVEIKNTQLGAGSKANHLAYVGDAIVGEHANIGAGTITCNYDGANKHITHIEDRAFIGSNVSLIAPIVIGQGATVGAGSTLGRNAPAEQLTVARAKQVSIAHWQRPKKDKQQKD